MFAPSSSPTIGNASLANLSHLTTGQLFSPTFQGPPPPAAYRLLPGALRGHPVCFPDHLEAGPCPTLPPLQIYDSTNEAINNIKGVVWLTNNKTLQKDVDRKPLSQQISRLVQALEHVLQQGYSKSELDRLRFSGTSSSLLRSNPPAPRNTHGLPVGSNDLGCVSAPTYGVRLLVNIRRRDVLGGHTTVPTISAGSQAGETGLSQRGKCLL